MSAPLTIDAPAAPEAGPGLFPCSATQERCWFLDQLRPGNPALNVAVRWNVRGRVGAASLEGAFRAVIARHEILRTRFVAVDGRPCQQVVAGADFRLSEIDIRATPEDEQAHRIEAIAVESALKPFDLTQPGLIRATLIRLGNDRAILAITAHQICFDGWSIRILGREVGEAAAAIDAGREPTLPDLALQYCDYALWQRAYLESDAFAEDVGALRRRLADAPYFELPPDHARPLERTAACGTATADLPAEWGRRLEAEARRRSMSPFAFGAAVLSAMLARSAGTSEVTLGTQVAGRTEVDLEPLIGVFINNVVLRLVAPEAETFESHLARSREVVREALMAQAVPFNKLVEAIGPSRDPSRTPLISVNFILQKAFLETARYGAFELSSAPSHAPGAIYDLNFILIGREAGWRMTLEYNADLFAEATAKALLDVWQAAFAFAFDHADRRLADMPVPTMEGRADPADGDLLSRVEATLAAHPDVAEAAVVRLVDGQGLLRSHAFVAPSEQATIPLETLPELLAEHLERTLPQEHHLPAVSVLRALPRDKAGRVARAMLPAPPPPPAVRGRGASGAGLMEVEARLARIWRDLLGLEEVRPSANFFDLGGHSLLTVRMLSAIEEEFGQRLSLAAVYRAPTLRALGRALGEGAPAPEAPKNRAEWRVLALQPEGDGVPLIAINNAQTVYAISEHFSRPRPTFAVRIFDKSRSEALPPRTFEEIAAAYVDAVRSARPHGPYALFGICVHGNLAVEVARQLRAAGEEVAAVVLKDVWEPRYADRILADRWALLLNRIHFVRVRWRFVRAGDMSLAAFLGTFRRLRNSGVLDLAVRVGLMDRVRFTDLDGEQEEFIAYLTEARNRHRPEPYDGTVLHFVTGESPRGRAFDATMGWSRVVTGPLVTRALDRLTVARSGRQGVDQAAQAIEEMLLAQEEARQA